MFIFSDIFDFFWGVSEQKPFRTRYLKKKRYQLTAKSFTNLHTLLYLPEQRRTTCGR